jgi:hypothetical protein
MSLSDLASIGSLVSGLAVLVSLFYLSLQNRQLERNQRALMNQGVINRGVEIARWLAEPQMSGLRTRLVAGETQFTAEELERLRLQLRVGLTSAQDAYVQHRAGLADQMSLDNVMATMRDVLALPVYRALWKSYRANYAPEWCAYIDRMIEETPLAKPVDSVAQFQANLAEVVS